jgi:hypothetical protein
MNETRVQILQKIIDSGGLFAPGAKMYLDDKDRGNDFIIECFEQCHTQMAFYLWGRELILAIVSYRLKCLRLLYEECAILEAELRFAPKF